MTQFPETPAGPPVLGLHNVFKSFGAQPVLADVSVTVHEGERVGLLGRNGAGKSTLLRIATGTELPDAGYVTTRQDLRMSMLRQHCALPREWTVGEVLEHAVASLRSAVSEYERLNRQLAGMTASDPGYDRLAGRVDHLHHHLEIHGAWEVDLETRRLSAALNLPARDRVLADLSGGEIRRVDLAATILKAPDLLLLDEPTNHIDIDSVQWIEDFLRGYAGTCMLVTHDRYFLERIVTRILEIDRTRLYSYPGSYRRYLELRSLREEQQARSQQNRLAAMRRELEWLRRGAKARSTKQKARIQRYDEMAAIANEPAPQDVAFVIPQPPRLGKRVLEMRGVSKSYGNKCLFRNVDLIMQKDMCVGIVGPNGSGKTTFLRVMMGLELPDAGEVTQGDTTQFLYVDQEHQEVHPSETVLHYVSGGTKEIDVNGRRVYVPGYLEQFLFEHDSVFVEMGSLSGGERNRIDIAKKLLRGGNFLVFDEPTNDLDLATLRVLEEAIDAFDGCAVLVSHDRYFLNRLCTHLLVFEGNGEVVQIAGDYDDYLLYRSRVAKAAGEMPKKVERPPALKTQERRLTYHEKKELASIEATILETENTVARLESEVNRPELYTRPHAEVKQVVAALEQARSEVERLYARWAELSVVEESSNG